MTKSARKIVIAVIAVILALAAATAGSLAWFSDSVSIHAGIKTSKMTGTVLETTMAGTPDTNETWLESSTTIKDGAKVLFSALTSDYKDSLGAKDTIKTYSVGRGNALSVTGDSAVKTNQTFKVKYSNTNNSDEVFYPEIHVTAVDGKSLAQYEKVLGVADTSAKATLDKTIQYQNVVYGTSEELLTANIYSIPSLVSKTKVNSDGSLSLYLEGVMVKAGETVECSYVLTENLSGHLDYTVPQVYVSTNATIRYASAVNSLWYGTAEAPSATSSVMYTLAPDYQTRVLWRDVTGKYTVRGGHDAITVSDKNAAATTEALDYTVAAYQYTGADQTPAAYLFGSKVNTKLYKAVDGKWTAVNAAVERGSYKAVVDTSDVEGFAVSHTEFYFSITKAVSNVDYGNKPGPDGQPDPDNKLTWSVDNADKEYDGKPISIVGTDKDGNTITDFIYTNKDTGESSEVPPKDVGTYVVKPKGDDNHEYTNTATITIRKKSLQVTPTVNKNPLLPTDKPSFGYTVTGFADGDNELDISGKGVQYIVDSNNVPASGQTYAVGSHDLTLSGLTAKNYDFVYGVTSFGVGKGTTTVEYGNKPGPDGQPDPENKLTWTDAASATKVYDGKALAVQAKDNDGNVVEVEYYTANGKTKLDAAPKDAGSYIAKAVESADYTYSNTATIEITKAALTVTAATDKALYLPSEIPVCSYTVTGFAAGEDESDINTDNLMYRADLVNQFKVNYMPFAIGEHTLDVEGLTSKSGNYSFAYNRTSFKVAKKDANAKYDNKPGTDGTPLTWHLNGATKVYDGKEVAVVATLPDGTVCPSITYIKSDGATMSSAPKDVGTYTVIPSSGDYNITNPATVIITPAPLTVTVGDVDIKDNEKPNFELSYAGLVNAETSDAVVEGTPIYTVTKDGAVVTADKNGCYPVGEYTVTVSGLSAANYSITFKVGTMTVTRSAIHVDITIPSAEKVYDGMPIEDVVATTSNGMTVEVSYVNRDTGVETQSAPKDAGTYDIKLPDGYEADSTTVVITKAPLTITLHDAKTSETVAPQYTYTVSGFAANEDEKVLGGHAMYKVTKNGSEIAKNSYGSYNAGTYNVEINGFSSDNYEITYVGATLTVRLPIAQVASFSDKYSLRGDGSTPTSGDSNFGVCNNAYIEHNINMRNSGEDTVTIHPIVKVSVKDATMKATDLFWCDGAKFRDDIVSLRTTLSFPWLNSSPYFYDGHSVFNMDVVKNESKDYAITENSDGSITVDMGEIQLPAQSTRTNFEAALLNDFKSFADKNQKKITFSIVCAARYADESVESETEIFNSTKTYTVAPIDDYGVAWRDNTKAEDWVTTIGGTLTVPYNGGETVKYPTAEYYRSAYQPMVATYNSIKVESMFKVTYYKNNEGNWVEIAKEDIKESGTYKAVAEFDTEHTEYNRLVNLTNNTIEFTVKQ